MSMKERHRHLAKSIFIGAHELAILRSQPPVCAPSHPLRLFRKIMRAVDVDETRLP
jgi:hypothetical protein